MPSRVSKSRQSVKKPSVKEHAKDQEDISSVRRSGRARGRKSASPALPRTDGGLVQSVKMEDGDSASPQESKTTLKLSKTNSSKLHGPEGPVTSPALEESPSGSFTTYDMEKKAASRRAGTQKRKRNTGYGFSPYPDYSRPTPEECEEVHRLLSKAHGSVKARTGRMAPVRGRATCGEVELLLDALLRTLLSANTSNLNSNAAVSSLETIYPVPEGGSVTINWAAVHQSTQAKLADALSCGGLQNVKAGYIKKTLQKVYDQNIQRREALIEEQKTGVQADIPGISTLTAEQKAAEIALISEDPFSLEWVRELETPDVMDTLIKFPGISFKTVSCALMFNLRRPVFAVDTHVHRMCKWLEWVPTGPGDAKDHPDKTFFHVDLHMPDELKLALHTLFIRHGKRCYHCKANTSVGTAAWKAVVCPIEHLLNRKEAKKQPGYRPSASEVKRQAKEALDGDSEDEMDKVVTVKRESKQEMGDASDSGYSEEPPRPKHARTSRKGAAGRR